MHWLRYFLSLYSQAKKKGQYGETHWRDKEGVRKQNVTDRTAKIEMEN